MSTRAHSSLLSPPLPAHLRFPSPHLGPSTWTPDLKYWHQPDRKVRAALVAASLPGSPCILNQSNWQSPPAKWDRMEQRKKKKKRKELHHYHHGKRLEPCLDQDKHEPNSLKPESLYKAINLLFAISKGKTSFHPQKWLPQGAPREAFLWRIALSMVTLPRHLFVSLTPFL